MFRLPTRHDKAFLKGNPARASANGGIKSASTQNFPDFRSCLRRSGRWLLVSDMCALAASFVAGAALVGLWHRWVGNGGTPDFFRLMTARQFLVFWALGGIALLWLDSRGHYRLRLPYWETVGHILNVACAGFVASGFIEFASHNNGSRLWAGFGWILFAFFAIIGRACARRWLACRGMWHIPALMIGDGATAAAARDALARDKAMGFKIIEQRPSSVLSEMNKTHVWKQVLMLHDAQFLFLALEGGEIERYKPALKSMPRARVPCSIFPPWSGLPSATITRHHFLMHDVVVMHDTNRLTLPLPCLSKRVVDVILASGFLLVFSWAFLLIAFIVRRDGGTAIFRQTRIGRGGRPFQCYKFRSMRVDAEVVLARTLAENPQAAEEWRQFQKLKNDVRVTRFGRFIRHYSLDELPQLINVLKGDMSLVGPRPCMPGQENLYAEDFSFYESVRPGITGPWQVSGRNHLTFQERVALEAWYARNWSLWLDIVIILKTFPILLKRDQAF